MDLEDLIKKSIIKIESIFKEQSTNKITIQRKYLQEIFSAELIEISKNDGLPTLKSFVIEYFKNEGIVINIYGNEVQFIRKPNLIILNKKNINPNFHPQMNYLKSMFMKQIYDKSKKAGDEDLETKAKMHMGLQLFDEIYQKALIMMKKEEKEFFEKYPELLPINTDEKEDDLNPKWIYFRNYYKEKLNNELKKNKYEEQSMEKWKREAMVQYLLLKFNEIYRKAEELKVAEEEATKFYKKLPKTYKKFLKALPKR